MYDRDKDIDYYELLGIKKTATKDVIQKAFQLKALEGDYRHPDYGGDQ